MIETTKELGPYIVITNMLRCHMFGDGVERLGMSINVLKNPIEFGSKENDPVKYVFCLAATENNRHLNAMAELVCLLDDPQFYYLLDTSQDPNEIYDYLSVKETLLG